MIEVEVRTPLTQQDVAKCKATWLATLSYLGSPRSKTMPSEEQLIARAIQQHGAEWVNLALLGARFEPATKDFNPKMYIDIARILLPDKMNRPRIQKFIDYGMRATGNQERVEAQIIQQRKEEVKREQEEKYVEPSEDVKRTLIAAGFGSILKGMPRDGSDK